MASYFPSSRNKALLLFPQNRLRRYVRVCKLTKDFNRRVCLGKVDAAGAGLFPNEIHRIEPNQRRALCNIEQHGVCDFKEHFRHRVSDAVGVVAVGFPDNPEQWTEAVDIPVIWTLRSTSRNSDVVQEDNREIARLASEYFLDNGHRHVGFVSDSHVESVCERGWFLEKFMHDGGGKAVVKTGENIFYQKLDRKQTRRLLEDIMASKPKPTALFVPGDRLCVAVYSILQDMGIRPQEDLTVLSCNNDGPFLYTMFPRPATIGMNVDVIGRRAAEIVLWRIANPEDQPVRILIRPELILPD